MHLKSHCCQEKIDCQNFRILGTTPWFPQRKYPRTTQKKEMISNLNVPLKKQKKRPTDSKEESNAGNEGQNCYKTESK